MYVISQQRRSFAFIVILCGFLLEAAAGLPFLAPEVIWVSAEHSPVLHLLAALLTAGGAASLFSAGRGPRQWFGPALFFFVLAAAIPVAGLLAVLVLAVVLYAHHREECEAVIPFEELPDQGPLLRPGVSISDAGPIREPLVSMLGRLQPESLQKIVLGMGQMPPAATRPLLQKLQKHSDVRVQLYANGLLNDQLDFLERRLATLKQRLKDHPNDEQTRTDLVESYASLFEHGLVASDEVEQIAGQALIESAAALELNPANPPVLAAHINFHLLRGEFREASAAIAQLHCLPGHQEEAAALHAKLSFEYAGTNEVPPTPVGMPGSDAQGFSAQN